MNRNIQDFLAESEEILDSLSEDLADLADCADAGEYNPDLLNSIFRGAHSLKGLAGMFGFASVQKFAHSLENLLDSLRLGKVTLSLELVTVLYESVELLGTMVRHAVSGNDGGVDTEEMEGRIRSFLVPKQDTGGENSLSTLGLPPQTLNSLTEYEEHRLLENIRRGRRLYMITVSFDLETFDQDLGALTDRLKKQGEVISTLPSVSDGDDGGITFAILFGTELDSEGVTGVVSIPRSQVSRLGGEPVVAEIPPSPSPIPSPPSSPVSDRQPAGSTSPQSTPKTSPGPLDGDLSAKNMSRTVRVDIAKLDELMNIVGELALNQSSIGEYAARLREESFSPVVVELGKAVKSLERKLSELQKGVMDIRMIPVGQLYEKLSRIVRKISREQGKKIELRLFGADTELDKLIIEDISDPLMHIIRNAIDHGIESPAERLLLGKDEMGTITLSSYQKGNHVVIEVIDDGRGMDIEKIARKALERGVVTSVDQLSEREILDLIFLPGFSTADTVTDLSGRGVGMDVVRTNIAAVSGMVDIETEKGKGSRIIITLPITLAIIKSLIIEASGKTFAIPITSVLESLIVRPETILTVERKRVINLRNFTLPLLSLSEYFGYPPSEPLPDEYYVVVVGVAEKRLGLIVNDLLGQRDIVIKPLGSTFRGVKGVSGAADLGDQRTILVLDVGGIITEATRSLQRDE
ncbi:MAG: chemotaxis protein CheA [Desulfuromonadia bacterium]